MAGLTFVNNSLGVSVDRRTFEGFGIGTLHGGRGGSEAPTRRAGRCDCSCFAFLVFGRGSVCCWVGRLGTSSEINPYICCSVIPHPPKHVGMRPASNINDFIVTTPRLLLSSVRSDSGRKGPVDDLPVDFCPGLASSMWERRVPLSV